MRVNKPGDGSKVNDMIVEYYEERFDESARLGFDIGPLELERTRQILTRYAPAPPAVVLDIGGGTGVYSVWLRTLGYEVHLVDPVPRHVTKARRDLAKIKSERPWSATHGYAGELAFDDGSADLVLLLGPLYHLQRKADRMAAYAEVMRVLKPGGLVCAAIVSQFASVLDGMHSGFITDPEFVIIVREDLANGCHANPTCNPLYWTDAYLQHPYELRHEMMEAGFHVERILPVEGLACVLRDFAKNWENPSVRRTVLELIHSTEDEPSILGISPHILGIGKKAQS